MRYYKKTNKNGQLLMIGTGLGGIEITAEEYAALSEEIENTDLSSLIETEAQNVDDGS